MTESTRTEKVRLCFLLEGYLPIANGASVHLSRLLPFLAARGAVTTVISRLTFPTDIPLEQTPTAFVVKVGPRVGMKRIAKFAMLPGVFLALIRFRKRYDTIITCDLKVLGLVALVAAKLLGKKCILRAESCGEIDGSYGTKYRNEQMSFLKTFFYDAFVHARNRLLRRSDGFLCICSAIEAEFMRGGLPPKLLIRTTNGVDTNFFKPATPERRAELREKFGIGDELAFIYTGRLAPGKGLEYLTEAWLPFHETQNGKLFLVGGELGFSNQLEIRLREFVIENNLEDSVVFTGKVDNVLDYLQAGDVFVLPSQSEATSLSLLEAMACGMPGIVTAVDGNVDLVRDDENGILVPYQDHQALLEAMTSLSQHPEDRLRLGMAARASVVERNDSRKVVDVYLSLGIKN